MNVGILTEGSPQTQSVVHRVRYLQEFLKVRGHSVKVGFGVSANLLGHRYNRARVISIAKTMIEASQLDVIIIHRAADPLTGVLATVARHAGVRVVFDMDDAVYLQNNPLTVCSTYLIKRSDAVTVGSHAIAQYCGRFNTDVVVVPSPVDTDLFAPSGQGGGSQDPPVVGWMGDGRVHAANLKLLLQPLLVLAETHRYEFKLVSALANRDVIDMFRPLESKVALDYGNPEWVEIAEIPAQIASFDISVMPLLDNAFNRGKAGQKLLESMAMEIPVVASPVGENSYIVNHGEDGFLASTRGEWVQYLSRLLEEAQLRQKFGRQGRRKVLSAFSIERCGLLYEKTLLRIVEKRN